jgi:hypothetical protein
MKFVVKKCKVPGRVHATSQLKAPRALYHWNQWNYRNVTPK